MTRTRSTERVELHDQWREANLPMLGNYSELGEKPWSELREYEIFPGCKLGDEKLVIPENWMPAGVSRRLSARVFDPAAAGVPSDPVLAEQRDEAIRRALLALWLPWRSNTGVRKPKPNTWSIDADLLLKLAAWQLTNQPTADGSVFGGFTVTNVIQDVIPAIAQGERSPAFLSAVFRKLIFAGQQKRLNDWPRLYAEGASIAEDQDGPTIERDREGRDAQTPLKKSEPRNWQPFSDVFVTEFIRRALWIQNNLADQLIEVWEHLRDIGASQAALGRTSGNPAVIELRRKAIEAFHWVDSRGTPIKELPFEVAVADGASKAWPPTSANHLKRMITTLQAVNLAVIGFCTGARASELAAAEDTERQGTDGRLHSVTFKLIDDVSGNERDWPLHPAAVRAVELQQKLSRLVRPPEAKHLWVLIGKTAGQPMLNLTEPLVQAVEHLGLSDLTGEDRAHMHRWRHTVARLVALSVIGAPQVLLDLFGHRDLDMTLRYMLSDPRIVEDAMKVAKETSYAMAEEAIVDTIEETAGGPAAAPLREGLAAAGMRRGEQAFETSTLRETAEVLTFNNRFWSLVRPGVLCTKGLGQFGPCTKDRGAPDPGACRTTCDHRLETSRSKQSCEDTLKALIAEREHALAEGADMIVANVDGQILANLERWDDVRDQVLASHPEIQAVWEAAQ